MSKKYLAVNPNGCICLFNRKPERIVEYISKISYWFSGFNEPYMILSKYPKDICNLSFESEPVVLEGEFNDFANLSMYIDNSNNYILFEEKMSYEI